MRIINLVPLFLICWLMTSCTGGIQPVTNSKEYFNIENYFSDEVTQLTLSNPGITKTLFQNDSSETLPVDSVNWSVELKPFLDIGLNKPALVNSYTVDSVFDGTRMELIFSSKDETPTLNTLRIIFHNDIPDTIIAINRTANMYNQSIDTLCYFGNGNYHISTWNKPRIGKEISFVLEGRTNKN